MSGIILAGLLLATPAIHAQSYSVDGFNVIAGGGSSSNGPYSVSGTIGQPSYNYTNTSVKGVLTETTPINTNGVAPADGGRSLSSDRKSITTPTGMSVNNSETIAISATVKIENPTVLPNGQVRFLLRGLAGQSYVLEMSLDLIHWQVLATGALSSERYPFVDQSASGAGRRFYRVSAGR
jgi:hypothetical protein